VLISNRYVFVCACLVSAAGCGSSNDGANGDQDVFICGSAGTHTLFNSDGFCACEDGFVWNSVATQAAIACIPRGELTSDECPNGCQSPIGGPCSTTSDCVDGGRCMRPADGFAGGYCTIVGCGQSGCPDGSECMLADGVDLCLAKCAVGRCRDNYTCYSGAKICWTGGCTADSCPDGSFCAGNGSCVPNESPPAPSGSLPDCSNVPSWECDGNEAYCGELVPFEPALGDGYWNYAINGETDDNQYRSFVRRDVTLLVKHAAAATACLTAAWPYGNKEPLGLGDMSEANGAIPGTAEGDPAHPPLSHTDGHDMDIAYFQLGAFNNVLREVCPHKNGASEQYHCVAPPDVLDEWRTAVFAAKLSDSPQTLWIGMDGKVGPIIEDRIDDLCASGWISGRACSVKHIEYEIVNHDWGWYYFHHHHMHLSMTDQSGHHPEL
jgi:hypothetical protein